MLEDSAVVTAVLEMLVVLVGSVASVGGDTLLDGSPPLPAVEFPPRGPSEPAGPPVGWVAAACVVSLTKDAVAPVPSDAGPMVSPPVLVGADGEDVVEVEAEPWLVSVFEAVSEAAEELVVTSAEDDEVVV